MRADDAVTGQGFIHVYTGDGKGKTTASIGLAVRSAGQGRRVLFVQFFKEDSASSGEKEFFKDCPSLIELVRSNCRHPVFTGHKTDVGEVKRRIADTFSLVKKRIARGDVDLLVLDEMMSAINGGFIPLAEATAFIEGKPVGLELVLTGRDAPIEITRLSDYVTEMLKIKHPFDAGVPGRKGIEY